jgi:hypothetical protein
VLYWNQSIALNGMCYIEINQLHWKKCVIFKGMYYWNQSTALNGVCYIEIIQLHWKKCVILKGMCHNEVKSMMNGKECIMIRWNQWNEWKKMCYIEKNVLQWSKINEMKSIKWMERNVLQWSEINEMNGKECITIKWMERNVLQWSEINEVKSVKWSQWNEWKGMCYIERNVLYSNQSTVLKWIEGMNSYFISKILKMMHFFEMTKWRMIVIKDDCYQKWLDFNYQDD